MVQVVFLCPCMYLCSSMPCQIQSTHLDSRLCHKQAFSCICSTFTRRLSPLRTFRPCTLGREQASSLWKVKKTARGKIRSSLQALVSAFGCRARGSVSTTPHEEISSTRVPTALVEDLLCRIARNNHEIVNLDLLCCCAAMLGG